MPETKQAQPSPVSSEVPLYDALAADYDRFVKWEGRLAHELPFFLELFEERRVQRVLDAACGTGHHAIALAERGYEVLGADASTAMIQQARRNAASTGVDVPFAVVGLGELASLGEGFDAVLCLGNSLPHMLSTRALANTLADFAAVLRPGGVAVIQNRNFDLVCAEHERFLGPQSYNGPEGKWIFVRFYDFHPKTITFNMIRLHRGESGWEQAVDSTELRPILCDDLAEALADARFGDLELYGGYDGSAFRRDESDDLIAVATRMG